MQRAHGETGERRQILGRADGSILLGDNDETVGDHGAFFGHREHPAKEDFNRMANSTRIVVLDHWRRLARYRFHSEHDVHELSHRQARERCEAGRPELPPEHATASGETSDEAPRSRPVHLEPLSTKREVYAGIRQDFLFEDALLEGPVDPPEALNEGRKVVRRQLALERELREAKARVQDTARTLCAHGAVLQYGPHRREVRTK